jgi:hypothetical protein
MMVRLTTLLDTAPDKAWAAVKRSDTLRYVTRGLLGFGGTPLPEEWRAGETVRTRLLFFHLLPAWTHELRIIRVDGEAREILTNEGGAFIKTWSHLITVRPHADGGCLYTDEIEVRAGVLTPFVWLYASAFYRYRQMRWRRLASTHHAKVK